MHRVRPISARALKSATDTLRPWLHGARVLDLFCGHGRFGLSALHENALAVTFVDLRKLTTPLPPPSRFLKSDVFSFLNEASYKDEKYDIIFADPPFPMWNDVFRHRLFEAVVNVCAKNAIFLVKYPSRMIVFATPEGFQSWKSSTIGESKLAYFRHG